MTGSQDLSELLERVQGATGADRDLNCEVAIALGWRERKQTGLGLNGRTPGRWGWVSPEPPWIWKASLPSLIGPRTKAATVALLKALQAQASDTQHGSQS